jgi:Right handed beta helix region
VPEARIRLRVALMCALSIVVRICTAGAGTPDLQAQIDKARRSGVGVTTIHLHAAPGQTSIVLNDTVRVPSYVQLLGPPGGLVIEATDDPGHMDRSRPVFVIAGTADRPATQVTLRGLRLAGNFARAPIVISDADGVTISDGDITGSRGGGVAISFSRQITVSGMDMRFVRVPASNPDSRSELPREGGAGIWCFACDDVRIENNVLDSAPFWQSGPSWDSGNAAVCTEGKRHPGCRLSRAADHLGRALDLVAFYGGARDTIESNRLSHGNTAAIYLNRCSKPSSEFPAQPSDFRISGNQVSNMRENGIDIVGAIRPRISGNLIVAVGGAGVALAEASDAVIDANRIAEVGQAWHLPDAAERTAAIKLLMRTRDTILTGNHIDPDGAAYSFFFSRDTTGSIVGGKSPGMMDNMAAPGRLGVANPAPPDRNNRFWQRGKEIP